MNLYNFFWGKSVVSWWLSTVQGSTDRHVQCAWERDLTIKMREQTSNQNIMTWAGIWSRPEALKAVLQKCRGDPAAHRTLYFIRKKLPTMVVTFATLSGPWLSSVLTQRESCCLHHHFLNRRSLQCKSEDLNWKSWRVILTRGTAQELVPFYMESFTTDWMVAVWG